jgi:CarD family transcriptional regulator
MAQKKKIPVKATAKTTAKQETKKSTSKTVTAKTSASKAPAKSAPVKAAAKPVARVAPKVAVKAPAAKVAAAPAAKIVVAMPAVVTPVKAPVSVQPKQPVPHAVAPSVAAGAMAARAPSVPVQRTIPSAITNPTSQTITAPAAPAADAGPRKPISTRHGFKTNEWIVYPSHGVGRIVAIEEQEIAGMALELFVITFEKDKMTLRVPTGKSQSVGMRKLADDGIVKRAMETLKGKARIKRTMWSRRAQEFEAKINSGDLVAIAEVVRDLFRADNQPEQSYSERQLYEAALDRMAREVAACEKIDERGAHQRITEVLNKSAKGRRAAADEAAAAETKAA